MLTLRYGHAELALEDDLARYIAAALRKLSGPMLSAAVAIEVALDEGLTRIQLTRIEAEQIARLAEDAAAGDDQAAELADALERLLE